jgi:hypothetical protein
VNVCGDESDRRVQVSLNLGEIKAIDSLFSFDIILQYDTAKFWFRTGLYVNTLAEFFDYKGVNVDSPGYLRLYAANMLSPQVVGNKPLIAFEGLFESECPDSMHIKLIYQEIEVSKDLMKRLDFSNDNLTIVAGVKETETSFVSTQFLTDTVKEFNEDSTISVICNLNTNNLDKVNEFDVVIDYDISQNLKLQDINNINDKLTILGEIENLSDELKAKYKFRVALDEAINDENFLELIFRKSGNEDNITKLNLNLDNINDCTCATSMKGDSIFIVTEKDTTTEVVVEYKIENNEYNIYGYYNYSNDEFIIDSEIKIKRIMLYDLEGRLIKIIRNNLVEKRIDIDCTDIKFGVYFVNVLLNNGFENNIVLIKN